MLSGMNKTPFTKSWNATYLWKSSAAALNSSSVDSEVRSDAFFSCMYMSMKGLGVQIMDYPNYN